MEEVTCPKCDKPFLATLRSITVREVRYDERLHMFSDSDQEVLESIESITCNHCGEDITEWTQEHKDW